MARGCYPTPESPVNQGDRRDPTRLGPAAKRSENAPLSHTAGQGNVGAQTAVCEGLDGGGGPIGVPWSDHLQFTLSDGEDGP